MWIRATWLRAWLKRVVVVQALLLPAAVELAHAGVLTPEVLARWFPPPYVVGEREKDVPVWPIFKQSGPPHFTSDLVGYVFESIDLAPVPGFAGTPINLLIALDVHGEFVNVAVLSHNEPVFVGGIGEEPLTNFIAQYKGLSLKQHISVASGATRGSPSGGSNVHLDGIAKATASLRIINQSVLSAALGVARAKLGFSGSTDPSLVAHVRSDLFESRNWQQLVDAGLVQRLLVRNRDVEQAFAGSEGAELDPEALAQPEDVFADLYVAMVTVPTAGRNLLTEAAWTSMNDRTHPGDHVLLVMSKGRYRFIDEDFQRNTVPDRLSLAQDALPIEMRDLDLDSPLRSIGQLDFDLAMAFRVIHQAGLDPGRPMQLAMRVTRTRGIVYPERFDKDFTLDFTIPAQYLVAAAEERRTWVAAWEDRKIEIALLLLSLTLLTWVLARQSRVVVRERELRWFRPVFLAFTLLFIGWYAQGQLSIVNLVALLQATIAWRSWEFVLYDPLSTILWIYVLGTLFVWGRGTFCGWLCPFGALQEFAAMLARLARIPQRRVSQLADHRLKRIKYGLLALIAVAAVASADWAARLVELEPFKTAITMRFDRTLPFVAYAVVTVLIGMPVYKFFCRYLCPLGASLALAGRVRKFDWLPRRAECGKPCQLCRHRCEYQAIERDGRIDYDECFQCMDCVAIYASDELCAPRILERKSRRKIRIRALPAAEAMPTGG